MDIGNENAADTLEEELCMGYSEPIHQVFHVYREVLGEFAYDLGFSIEFHHFVSSSDRWSVRTSYSDSRGYVEVLHHRLSGHLGETIVISWVCVKQHLSGKYTDGAV
ncbi:hypothetical protein GQ457_06G008490 [Hibiscus cannabinus]